MKKRSLAILAGGMSLALLLSACGPASTPAASPSSEPAGETQQQTAEAEPVTITYCNFNGLRRKRGDPPADVRGLP